MATRKAERYVLTLGVHPVIGEHRKRGQDATDTRLLSSHSAKATPEHPHPARATPRESRAVLTARSQPHRRQPPLRPLTVPRCVCLAARALCSTRLTVRDPLPAPSLRATETAAKDGAVQPAPQLKPGRLHSPPRHCLHSRCSWRRQPPRRGFAGARQPSPCAACGSIVISGCGGRAATAGVQCGGIPLR